MIEVLKSRHSQRLRPPPRCSSPTVAVILLLALSASALSFAAMFVFSPDAVGRRQRTAQLILINGRWCRAKDFSGDPK